MQIRKIPLIQLQNLNPTSTRQFVEELECNGFAILTTNGYTEQDVILRTLTDSQGMKTFRFPSHSEKIQYSEDQRQSFKTLFKWGRLCLQALLREIDPDGVKSQDLLQTLHRSEQMSNLFPPNGLGHTPFPEGVEFSGSFFNIFHYDYGLLNHHQDRYLVTVVAVDQQPSSENKTALWVQSPSAGWVNVDAHLQSGEIAIFTGEDFERVSSTMGRPIKAVVHCTRVDPTTERLVCYDNQPDPSTSPSGNRVSMAFVLSEAAD